MRITKQLTLSPRQVPPPLNHGKQQIQVSSRNFIYFISSYHYSLVLSDHFLSVFYFSLGLMMNWQLLFSKPLLDLSIILITFFSVLSFHIVFIFGLSKMWNYLLERFLPKSIQEKWKIDHDSVLIAR